MYSIVHTYTKLGSREMLPLCTVLYILTMYSDIQGYFLFVQYCKYVHCIGVDRYTSTLFYNVYTYAILRSTGIIPLYTEL